MDRLHRSESGAEGARRIARAQIAEARRALSRRPLSDDAVHSARKSLKKARAMFRLLRPSIGGRVYHRENAALRKAAGAFGGIRDARVLLETLEALARRMPDATPTVRELQRLLRREQALIRSRLRPGSGRTADPIRILRASRRRTGHWRFDHGGWSVLGTGLRRMYGQARRGFARARAHPSAANLHEWRKQTKYLCHQLQVLEPLGTAVARRAGLAHHLAHVLGAHHDLWMLRARVSSTVQAGAGRRALLDRIDRRSVRLGAQAFALGQRLYADTGPAFEARLHALWRAWRHPPRIRAAARTRGASPRAARIAAAPRAAGAGPRERRSRGS